MTKKLLLAAAVAMVSLTACAEQNKNQKAMEQIKKGQMEVYDFKKFKLHVYRTCDALGDVSFIIEGKRGLVTLEHPLFKENITEYNAYIAALDKPIEKIIADYHTGGYADLHNDVVMVEGMPQFETGEIYGGMMQNFAQIFGDAIDVRPHAEATTVDFGHTQRWAGVTFEFRRGASTDFPAASIIIGDKVYYTHWTPAKAHVSSLQVSSPVAVDAEIAEARCELDSGCELFVGGHGGVADRSDVEFKIAYLERVKSLLSTATDATAFAAALHAAYPDLPGKENVEPLAAALYK